MEDLSFASRAWLALVVPFKVLFDGTFAAQVAHLGSVRALPEAAASSSSTASAPDPEPNAGPEPTVEPSEVATVEADADVTAALQLLSILQREGRLIDFLQEDMSAFADAEIGAAARVVQQGCKKGLAEYVEVVAIRTEAEGSKVRLDAGYDAQATRVTGNITGHPPYSGVLAHHGWRVNRIVLPRLSESHDPTVLAPAEVEVGA